MTATVVRRHLLSPLQLLVLLIAGALCLPLGYVLVQAATTDSALWSRLWRTRLPELLVNTGSLAVTVSGAT